MLLDMIGRCGAQPSRAASHPAAPAALRASPPRPSMTRIAIEPSMRRMPGPTWRTATAWTWVVPQEPCHPGVMGTLGSFSFPRHAAFASRP